VLRGGLGDCAGAEFLVAVTRPGDYPNALIFALIWTAFEFSSLC